MNRSHCVTADQPISLGKMRVSEFSSSRFKISLGLENPSARLRMECSAGNGGTYSLLHLQAAQIQSPTAPVLFTGALDFYCEGLVELSRGLQVGDEVEVFFTWRRKQEEKDGQQYETMKISDLTFTFSDGQPRRYTSAGGGGGDFVATRPRSHP